MNTSLLLAIVFLFVFLAIIGLGYAIWGGPNLLKRLRDRQSDDEPSKGWRSYLSRSEKVLKPLGEFIPRSPEEMSRQERRLVRAGIRRKDGPLLFNGVKLSLIIVFLVIFISTRLMVTNLLLYASLSLLLGALIPDLWLTYRGAVRNDLIQLALPNALDLTVVCIEAGMGLDQALMRIGQEIKRGFPDLSDELHVLGLEVNAGRKRSDALRNLGNRTNNQDLKALVAVLIQTDRFGTSVAQALRTFSDTLRTTRRLRAEEHAAKMGVKMMPPLVFFIFPALLIVVVGPAVIGIIRDLIPVLTGR
jgi:tight adherence protein C